MAVERRIRMMGRMMTRMRGRKEGPEEIMGIRMKMGGERDRKEGLPEANGGGNDYLRWRRVVASGSMNQNGSGTGGRCQRKVL